MNANFFLQLTINGLLLGAFYAATALGFSTIWGVMRLINLAHGEFLLMGAFVAWFFFNPTREQNLVIGSINPLVTLLIILAVAAAVGLRWSEFAAVRQRVEDQRSRRAIGIGAALIVGVVGYAIWNSAELADISLSMMALVMVGLALSIGLVLSRALAVVKSLGNVSRWIAGYLIGAAVAFTAYNLWQSSGFPAIDPFLTLPVIFLLFYALGYVLQRGLLNRIVEAPHLTALLMTFAISIVLQDLGLNIFAADPRRINVDYGPSFQLGDTLTLPPNRLFILIASVAMVLILSLFLRRTRTGYAIRAAAQNKMAARLMGIDVRETYAVTFGISLALTAVAGAMMGTFQPITPVTGAPWTLRAFAIVALGGLGKVEGAVIGGMVIGLGETYIGGYTDVGWGIAATFIILVIALVANPRGLSRGLRTQEE